MRLVFSEKHAMACRLHAVYRDFLQSKKVPKRTWSTSARRERPGAPRVRCQEGGCLSRPREKFKRPR